MMREIDLTVEEIGGVGLANMLTMASLMLA
jgi:hypothetical protein